MRGNTTMSAYLDHLSSLSRRLDHGAAFLDRVADGLFDIYMSSGLDCRDHDQWMPMVGCGYDANLRLLLVQEFSKILVLLWLVTGPFADVLYGRRYLTLVHVTQCDNPA
jgi:hypothetical protein